MQPAIIQNKIYEIRGQKVMLDKDLAELYGTATKSLNLAVKRNKDRFPSDFMFRLTQKEFDGLRFQFETSKSKGGTRYLPYAFTQLGVSMLSSVLNSPKAIRMNINIMRAFVSLVVVASMYKNLAEKIKKIRAKVDDHDEQLDQIYDVIKKLFKEKQTQKTWKDRPRIGFKN